MGNTSTPYFLLSQDQGLIGSASSRDPLGILPVWSTRGRDLVPHLTEQTTNAEGFQVLITILWLWQKFVERYPRLSGEQKAFYLVIEQAFGRSTGKFNKESWVTPGKLRVQACADQAFAELSIKIELHHLLANQMANGTWGLYRGAAGRAGLLESNLQLLESATATAVEALPLLSDQQCRQLFELVLPLLDDTKKTVEMSLHGNSALARVLADIVVKIPQSAHLLQVIIKEHELTSELAMLLLKNPDKAILHKTFLENARGALPKFAKEIDNVLRCEAFLSPIESIFLWLCGQKGKTLSEAANALLAEGFDLHPLQNAHDGFCNSGHYPDGGPKVRWARYADNSDLTSTENFLFSLLKNHEEVSKERGRETWIELGDNARLSATVEVGSISLPDMLPATSWRNDYYLWPLKAVVKRLTMGGSQ